MTLPSGFLCQAFAFRGEFLVFPGTGFHAEQTRRWNRAFRKHSGLAEWNPQH